VASSILLKAPCSQQQQFKFSAAKRNLDTESSIENVRRRREQAVSPGRLRRARRARDSNIAAVRRIRSSLGWWGLKLRRYHRDGDPDIGRRPIVELGMLERHPALPAPYLNIDSKK
jgi:hypothetical protein